MLRKLVLFPALLAIAVGPLLAQADDPPSRVARLNLLSGSVSFRPGSVEEWTAATLNYPLTTGDHLWADTDSRVEIHAGSTAIRMAGRTGVSVLNLDDRTVQLALTDGTLHIRLRHLDDDETFEVDTPNVAITLLRAGEYRIDADGDAGATSLTVRSGNANVTGGGAAITVRPRQTGRAVGMDNVTQEIGPALPSGEFDRWCEARDRREDGENISARYVPRDMVGYEDLDEHGVWSEVPDYGPVWRPREVEIGWAPYRYGHWAWVEPWGWTWIDDAPWGFAPFHYGRWAMIGGGWAWVPGQMVVGVRPVYAPALVAFVGTSRVGVAAWFPLGPREVYRPAYHVSDRYVRQVNITHVTNVTVVNNVYINQGIPGAVTSVSHDTFVSARHVGREAVMGDQREFARAQVIGTAAPIAPQRTSVLGRSGPAMAPPPRMAERPVVARQAPPAPPVPFESRRQALEANPGRPLDPGQSDRFRRAGMQNPQVRVAPPVSASPAPAPVVTPRDERPGMRRPIPAEQPPVMRPPQETPAPRFDRPQRVEQPAPAPRAERPAPPQEAPAPRFERPQRVEQPAPAPRVERPAPPQERPAPRFERPQPAVAPPPAPAPRVERPAPAPQPEAQKEERKAAGRRGDKKDEKK